MAKTAVVTGASRGIGRAIALKLADSGFNVVVNYLFEEEDYQGVVDEIKAKGVDVAAIKADVSNFDQAKQMMDSAVEQFGSIDVLVNNAGITKDGLLARMSEADFDSVINVNLKGVFNCCRHTISYMMKQRSGRIINIASVVGQAGQAGQTNYAASKGGIIAFTKALAIEVGSRNITVNAIAPGFVETSLTEVLPQKLRDSMMEKIPLKRGCVPEEVAGTVAFLSGDDSAYITGQVIAVNGGLYM